MANKEPATKTIRMTKADKELAKKLHQVTGIQSFTDLARLALRSLAEKLNVAA